jgi:hypothetical protein
VVVVGETYRIPSVAPAIGLAVLPLVPMYHWYVRFGPVALTPTAVWFPDSMERGKFVVVTAGAAQTVTVTASLSTNAAGVQVPVTRTNTVAVMVALAVTEAVV